MWDLNSRGTLSTSDQKIKSRQVKAREDIPSYFTHLHSKNVTLKITEEYKVSIIAKITGQSYLKFQTTL